MSPTFHLKTQKSCFHFFQFSWKHFYRKHFQNLKQTKKIICFLFLLKIETRKRPLKFGLLLGCMHYFMKLSTLIFFLYMSIKKYMYDDLMMFESL